MRNSITAIAAAIAVALSGGAMLTGASSAASQHGAEVVWQPSGGGDQHRKFVDHHGLMLRHELLYLIYPGNAWTQPGTTPTADQVTSAVRTMLASPYMTGLAQYRGVGRGELRGSTVLASSEPPSGFKDREVGQFVCDQISAGTIPGPDADDQTLYGVVMPPDVKPDDDNNWDGEHNWIRCHGHRIHYAWFVNHGKLDELTGVMSHEIVEAATDPQGTAFLGVDGTCTQKDWCEIADICPATGVYVDGVTVQSYWSDEDGKCIVPTGSVQPGSGLAAHGGRVSPADERRRTSPRVYARSATS
jgi:hypothetical protein